MVGQAIGLSAQRVACATLTTAAALASYLAASLELGYEVQVATTVRTYIREPRSRQMQFRRWSSTGG